MFLEQNNQKNLDISKEERLNKKVKILGFSTIQFFQIFKRVSNETDIKLVSEDFYNKTVCSIFAKDIEVYKVMDGLGALFLTRWVKEDVGRFTMIDNFEYTLGWVPESPEEVERCEASMPFLSEYLRLPSDIQDKLKNDEKASNQNNGLPLSALPPAMQQAIYSMMDVENKFKGKNSRNISQEEISNGRVMVDNSTSVMGTIKLFIRLNTSKGSYGALYTNTKKLVDNKTLNASNEKTYECKKWDIERKDYKNENKLKQEIILNGNYTIIDILKYLHDNFDISCISETNKTIPMRVSVRISKMPLWQFLEKMPETFLETEWEYRKSEVLVVRGPRNSARDNKRSTEISPAK